MEINETISAGAGTERDRRATSVSPLNNLVERPKDMLPLFNATNWLSAPSSRSPISQYLSTVESMSDIDKDVEEEDDRKSYSNNEPRIDVEVALHPSIDSSLTGSTASRQFTEKNTVDTDDLSSNHCIDVTTSDIFSEQRVRQGDARTTADFDEVEDNDRHRRTDLSALDRASSEGDNKFSVVSPSKSTQHSASSPSAGQCNDVVEPSVVRRLESFVAMMGNRRHRHHVQHQHQQQQFIQSSSLPRNGHRELLATDDPAQFRRRSTAATNCDDDERQNESHDISKVNGNGSRLASAIATSPLNGSYRRTTALASSTNSSGRSSLTETPLDLSLRARRTAPTTGQATTSMNGYSNSTDNRTVVASLASTSSSLIDGFSTKARSSTFSGQRRSDDRGPETADVVGDSLSKLEKTFGEHSRILDRVGYTGVGNGARRDAISSSISTNSIGGAISGFGTSMGISLSSTAVTQQSSSICGSLTSGIYDTALKDLSTPGPVGTGSSVGSLTKSTARRHQQIATATSSLSAPQVEQVSPASVSDRRRVSANTTNGRDYCNADYTSVTAALEPSNITEVGTTTTGADASKSTTAGVRRMVRGQDAWMNGTGQLERRSSVLRCLECGMSFWSLPELTLHMIQTAHYANIIRAPASTPSAVVTAASSSSAFSQMVLAHSTVAGPPEVTSSPSRSTADDDEDDDNNNKNIDDVESEVDSERDQDADASSEESPGVVNGRRQSNTDDNHHEADDPRRRQLATADGQHAMVTSDRQQQQHLWRRRRKRKRCQSSLGGASMKYSMKDRDEAMLKVSRLDDGRYYGDCLDASRSTAASMSNSSSRRRDDDDDVSQHPVGNSRVQMDRGDGQSSSLRRRLNEHYHHRHHHYRQPSQLTGSRSLSSSSSTTPPSTPSPGSRIESTPSRPPPTGTTSPQFGRHTADQRSYQRPLPTSSHSQSKADDDQPPSLTAISGGPASSALSAMQNFIGRSLVEMDRAVGVCSTAGLKPPSTSRHQLNTREKSPAPTASRALGQQPVPPMRDYQLPSMGFPSVPTSAADILPSFLGACPTSMVDPSAALAQFCWSPFLLDYLLATSRLFGAGCMPMVGTPQPTPPPTIEAYRDLLALRGNGAIPAATIPSILPMFAAAAAGAMPMLTPDARQRLADDIKAVCESAKTSSFDEQDIDGLTPTSKFKVKHHATSSSWTRQRLSEACTSPNMNGSSGGQFRSGVASRNSAPSTKGLEDDRPSSTSSGISGGATAGSSPDGSGLLSQALDSLRGFVYSTSVSTLVSGVNQPSQKKLERSSVDQTSSSISSSSSSLSSTTCAKIFDNQQHQQLSATTRRPFDPVLGIDALPSTPLKTSHPSRDSWDGATTANGGGQRSPRLSTLSSSTATRLPVPVPASVNGYRCRPQDDDEPAEVRRRTTDVVSSKPPITVEPESAEDDNDYDSRFDKYYRLARELTSQSH